MHIVIHCPQDRSTYDQAYDWILDPDRSFEHSRDEIIARADDKVLEAASIIRDWLKAELETTVGNYRAEVEEPWVARIAILLALEELEGWTDLTRQVMLDDLTGLVYARYRYEREEDDDDLMY